MAALEAKGECALTISVKDLSFTYPNGRRVFQDLTFEISEGRVLCVLGPNGAGKSTLLGCIARLLTPSAGDVLIDGKSCRTMPQQEIARSIGFVPQNIVTSFDYSVLDYVVTGCAPRMGVFQRPKSSEYAIAREAVAAMGLEHLAEKSIMRISSGERQQCAIARVLAQRPRFILLDEPTAHLDVGNQVRVLNTMARLAEDGYGVVMSTHNPDHALMLGDQIAAIDRQGHFTFGVTADVINDGFLSALYGTGLRVVDLAPVGRKVCVAQGIRRKG